MRTLSAIALSGAVACGDRDDLAGRLAAVEARLDQTTTDLLAAQSAVEALQAQVDVCATPGWVQSQGYSTAPGIPGLADYLSVDPDTDSLVFSGANVYVQSGSGATNDGGRLSGLGNLIVGYAEESGGADRTGSHNLVVGVLHSWTGYGGIVAGYGNTVSGAYASVLGGSGNEASADVTVVVGGTDNSAAEFGSAVLGGYENIASGYYATVSGGYGNEAFGSRSAVSAGVYNFAGGDWTSVAGGQSNRATGNCSAVAGGLGNLASGFCSAILGGKDNTASSWYTTVYGSLSQTADTKYTFLP